MHSIYVTFGESLYRYFGMVIPLFLPKIQLFFNSKFDIILVLWTNLHSEDDTQ